MRPLVTTAYAASPTGDLMQGWVPALQALCSSERLVRSVTEYQITQSTQSITILYYYIALIVL